MSGVCSRASPVEAHRLFGLAGLFVHQAGIVEDLRRVLSKFDQADMELERRLEIGGMQGEAGQAAQGIRGFRIGIDHLFVQALGAVAIAQSGIGECQVGLRFGPVRTVLQAAFERLHGAAIVDALQAQVARAEAGFIFFGSLVEHQLVPALGFVQLAGVLQKERDVPDGREGVGVGLDRAIVGRAGAGGIAELFPNDTEIGVRPRRIADGP